MSDSFQRLKMRGEHMPETVLYLVQSYDRRNGRLDISRAAYSRDRIFATDLAAGLAGRKEGVIAVGARIEADGSLAPEAEIIAGYGFVPTPLFFPEPAVPERFEAILPRDPAAWRFRAVR
jgi:hypothetical protein